jgi:hypothetical protein
MGTRSARSEAKQDAHERRHHHDQGHPELTGDIALAQPTFIMTEQVRTISRERLLRCAGVATDECLQETLLWLQA